MSNSCTIHQHNTVWEFVHFSVRGKVVNDRSASRQVRDHNNTHKDKRNPHTVVLYIVCYNWFSSAEFLFLWLPATEQKLILHLNNLGIKHTGSLIFWLRTQNNRDGENKRGAALKAKSSNYLSTEGFFTPNQFYILAVVVHSSTDVTPVKMWLGQYNTKVMTTQNTLILSVLKTIWKKAYLL